jgi:hypothetical protein
LFFNQQAGSAYVAPIRAGGITEAMMQSHNAQTAGGGAVAGGGAGQMQMPDFFGDFLENAQGSFAAGQEEQEQEQEQTQ